MTDAQLISKLKKEYQWRLRRYSESETGRRSHGGNCFNETNARAMLDKLEIEAETRKIDYMAIRAGVYG